MLHIAIFESDKQLATDIMCWLDKAGHRYSCCSNQTEFLACIAEAEFDLLLVDCRCTSVSSFESFRSATIVNNQRLPLLFISEPESEHEIVIALENGADDYMVKPFSAEELLSRLQVLHRRFWHEDSSDVLKEQQFGYFRIDHQQHQIFRNDELITLTDKDFSLSCYLFNHLNQLLSRHRLLTEVWGVAQEVNTRTVDMHISRLRKSLALEGSGYQIQTVHQHGYRMIGPEQE